MEFYKLIEIAVKLNESIDNKERLSNYTTKQRYTYWKNRMNDWIEENYKNDGILKRYKEEYQTKEKF